MKPGDHPDFFRFPAPAGRSRESTIVLRRDGKFLHDGAVVEHEKMARAFASWIRRHPDDHRFILENGFDWTYFTVEDTPFFVETLKLHVGEPVKLRLSDGTWESLDLDSLRIDADGVVCCSVKSGRFEARFQQSAQLQLEPLLVDGQNGIELSWNGQRVQPRLRAKSEQDLPNR